MTSTVYNFNAALCRLRRNPVLTTMMVYSVGLGVAALMAAVAVWRSTSICPIPQKSDRPYLVQASAVIHDRESPANYC
jgi:putative ABC transport system permease protein